MSTADVIDRYRRTLAGRDHLARPLLRVGLGVTILLAGLHKLLAPGAWHAYLAPPFAAAWPGGLLSLDALFVLFGVSEVPVGALLLADRWASLMAAVVAVSMLGVVVNLLVGLAVGDPVTDVLVRDLGLTAYAAGVAVLEADGE
jgi:uncharacterized membrane protein YphA (DoxX/SURF4 family)